MAKNTPVVVVPDDSALTSTSYAPLEKGTYEFIIDSIDMTTVKGGANAGKAAFNVKLKQAATNRVLWKLIPAFAVTVESPKNDQDWVRMARVSFVEALGVSNTELFINTESLVGKAIKTVVDAKDNGPSYGIQNFVVKFEK
jgi:hypothetical protein